MQTIIAAVITGGLSLVGIIIISSIVTVTVISRKTFHIDILDLPNSHYIK